MSGPVKTGTPLKSCLVSAVASNPMSLDYCGANGNCITSKRKKNNPFQLNIAIDIAINRMRIICALRWLYGELCKLLVVVMCAGGDHDSYGPQTGHCVLTYAFLLILSNVNSCNYNLPPLCS